MKIGKGLEVVGHVPLSLAKQGPERTGAQSFNPLPFKVRRAATPENAGGTLRAALPKPAESEGGPSPDLEKAAKYYHAAGAGKEARAWALYTFGSMKEARKQIDGDAPDPTNRTFQQLATFKLGQPKKEPGTP